MLLSIASWNINSINIRANDALELMRNNYIDILLLQEIKCENNNFPLDVFKIAGYYVAIHGQKSYNGVAIISKYQINNIITCFDDKTVKNESRYIQGDIIINNIIYTIASVYVPNGRAVLHEKYDEKLIFFDNLLNYIKQFKYKNFCIGGDFNVSPFDIDVYSVKKMHGILSFTDKEKQKFRNILNSGFYDIFRCLHSEAQEFSWWDYRGGSVENNKGLRIDMILASASMINKLNKVIYHKNFRVRPRPSDHIPVSGFFDI